MHADPSVSLGLNLRLQEDLLFGWLTALYGGWKYLKVSTSAPCHLLRHCTIVDAFSSHAVLPCSSCALTLIPIWRRCQTG